MEKGNIRVTITIPNKLNSYDLQDAVKSILLGVVRENDIKVKDASQCDCFINCIIQKTKLEEIRKKINDIDSNIVVKDTSRSVMV